MQACKTGPKILGRKGVLGTNFKHDPGLVRPPKAGSSKWLGQDGKPVNVSGNDSALVADVLARIDDMMAFNDWVFGVRGFSGNVILTDNGTNGGAYHMGCDFQNGGDWYEALYSPPAPAGQPGGITFGLVEAEVVESYMGIAFNGGQKTIDCGDSFGEALSRYLAMSVTGGTHGSMGTSGFVSAPSWDGTDWISRLSGTDGDYPSTGCGMVYISWMLKQGHTIDKIAQAGGPTCADNYSALTGKSPSQAWPDFLAAVNSIGGTNAIKNDNPFGAPDPVYPLSAPPTGFSLTASPTSGTPPLTVSFSMSGTTSGVQSLDFGDGTPTTTTLPATHIYEQPGTFTATLTTMDGKMTSATVSVGTAPPPPPPPGPGGLVGTGATQDYTFKLPGILRPHTVTIPGQTIPVYSPGSGGGTGGGEVDVEEVTEQTIEELKKRGISDEDLKAEGAFSPVIIGDIIALGMALISRNPAAIAAALAKLLADISAGS